MTSTLTSTAFTHCHELTYLRSVSTGWDISQPDALYGHRHGVCRDCGRDITQLVEAGVKGRDNRHPFRTSEELDLIEAAHAEALSACKHCGAAGHFAEQADEPDAYTPETYCEFPGCDELCELGAFADLCPAHEYDPFEVETWNERP